MYHLKKRNFLEKKTLIFWQVAVTHFFVVADFCEIKATLKRIIYVCDVGESDFYVNLKET